MSALGFTVYGTPRPAGSKRVLPAGGKKGGRPVVVDDAGKPGREWRSLVVDAAREAIAALERPGVAYRADAPLFLEGEPLFLWLTFYMARPKAHYGARGVLLPSAPDLPTIRPDLTKLTRAVEDALTGVVWRDDAQVAGQAVVRFYGVPRVHVVVSPVSWWWT